MTGQLVQGNVILNINSEVHIWKKKLQWATLHSTVQFLNSAKQNKNFPWRCLEASLFDIRVAFSKKASEARPTFYGHMSMDQCIPNKAAIRVPLTNDILRGHPIQEMLDFSYVWVINEFSKEKSPGSQDANSDGSRRTCPFLDVNRTSKVILRR